jgi:hypothetical protein
LDLSITVAGIRSNSGPYENATRGASERIRSTRVFYSLPEEINSKRWSAGECLRSPVWNVPVDYSEERQTLFL